MKVVIIGGGASGLVSAICSKNDHNEVIILEKNNTCGKKILATGNGHCNYWNSDMSINNYHSANKELLDKVINEGNCLKVDNFFTKLGIIPKIKNGYYYPMSKEATTIRNVLLNEVEKLGIIVKNNFIVDNVVKENNQFIITGSEKIIADKLIVSTGSYVPNNDGLAYKIAKSFNHEIIKVLPSLVQLETSGNFLKKWQGVRSEVVVYQVEDGKIKSREVGEIQLTNYGVSGICIFNLSGDINRGLSLNKKEELIINFLPGIEINPLDWFDLYTKNTNRVTIDKLLGNLLNEKLVPIILDISKINNNSYYDELSNNEKSLLIKTITNFKIQVFKTKDFSNAQTVTGGISLKDINLKTMESKKCSNLYFTGEILDIDGKCGGYNLGFAWISGILAGGDIYHA